MPKCGYGLLLLAVSGHWLAASAQTCEFEIQKNCLFDRIPKGDASPAADKRACEQCAQAHAADLEKHCNATQQVKDFCGAPKPVIGGFDVVEYFSLAPAAKGVMGSPEFAYNFTSPDADGSPRFTHMFWFKNEVNLQKFAADPWKYAPKNGAADVALAPPSEEPLFRKDVLGPPANASNTWNIVNGSLYMNASPMVVKKWMANLTGFIAASDALWISWYGKLHAGPFNTDCLQGHQHEQPSKGHYCRCATHPQPMPPAIVA